jgi:type I restriction enzyme S subunit
MTLDTFFKKFDPFAAAPGAVAKMRELVLELAVQGKLVEQKQGDGKAKAIFSDRLPEKGECRYELPATWMWIRFAAVGEQRLGKMLDQRGNRGDLKPYLRNTNVQWMRFQLDDVKELRLAPEELEEFRLQPDDLLICEGGEPGRCAIPSRKCIFKRRSIASAHAKGFYPSISRSACKWTHRMAFSRNNSPALRSSILRVGPFVSIRSLCLHLPSKNASSPRWTS